MRELIADLFVTLDGYAFGEEAPAYPTSTWNWSEPTSSTAASSRSSTGPRRPTGRAETRR
jgi:hypothetical protein